MHYHEVPKSEEASTMKVVIADQQSTNSETCSATHSSYMKYTYIYISEISSGCARNMLNLASNQTEHLNFMYCAAWARAGRNPWSPNYRKPDHLKVKPEWYFYIFSNAALGKTLLNQNLWMV